MNLPFECPVCGHKTNLHQTNADRIRAMTDEELAELLVKYDERLCVYRTDDGSVSYDWETAVNAELEWLQQPAEGD